MALGRKTGGRRPGTPNRRTLDVIERLDALGCDPIAGMAQIALNEAAPVEVRARMYAELAQYVAPKRKAVEHDFSAEAAAALSQPRVIEVHGVAPDPARMPPAYRPQG